MDWQKVVEEFDRLADDQYKEAYKAPFEQARNRGSSGFIPHEEVEKIERQSQRAKDFAFLFRSMANALRKGIEPPPQPALHDQLRVSDYATRLFNLHGFMLLETYKGKHAVTVTFPDLKEAQQFHNTLVELSQHRATSTAEGTAP